MCELKQEKEMLRAACKARREEISPELKAALDQKILALFLRSEFYQKAKGMLCYSAKLREVETALLIDHALAQKKRVALPRCLDGEQMAFLEIRSRTELVTSRFGLLEPREGLEPVSVEKYEICVVPGLAFDREGHRIGYGRGYYDRFLKNYAGIKVGLCYTEFLRDRIPTEKTDLPMDFLVTEKGVLSCKN